MLFKSSSSNRAVSRKGSGLLNAVINKLPVELHIPGYRFCGPGTKLDERLRRGDKGVNTLDEACKEHDISYAQSSELVKRHAADEKLYKKAVERVKSRDAGIGERLAAVAVSAAMKAKTKLGMGLRRKGILKSKISRNARKRKNRSARRRNQLGGAISFFQAMKKARNAIKTIGKAKGVLENARVAYQSLRKSRRRIKFPRSRVIGIPKQGGFLPLIPLFAALGALGSLGGGAAAIAKAVTSAKAERDQLEEAKRHNTAMESKSGGGLYIKPYKSGCGVSVGSGLYIKPYKTGCGVYLPKVRGSKNG